MVLKGTLVVFGTASLSVGIFHQAASERLGPGQIVRGSRSFRGSFCCPLSGYVALLSQPSGQRLYHRTRSTLELTARADLADHEIAQELTDVGKDVLGAEDLAELAMLITFGVIEAVEECGVALRQCLVWRSC